MPWILMSALVRVFDPANRADFHRALSRLPTRILGNRIARAGFGNLLFRIQSDP
jgi:hypothetical protein